MSEERLFVVKTNWTKKNKSMLIQEFPASQEKEAREYCRNLQNKNGETNTAYHLKYTTKLCWLYKSGDVVLNDIWTDCQRKEKECIECFLEKNFISKN